MPFDWHILETLALPVPFLVSGGLNADNVAQALGIVGNAAGVDVSSGVESSKGIKDASKIAAFINGVRNANV